MNEIKIRLIPFLGLCITIYLFFISLSKNFYPKNYVLYALIGAAISSICIYYLLKGIQDNEDLENSIPEKYKFSSKPSVVFSVISFVFFIGITIYLSIVYSNIKENELKSFGKITSGEIIDGFSLTGQRAIGEYKVTVEYRNDKDELIKAVAEVSPSEFNSYYVGERVNLIYSSKNYQLIDLLTDDLKVKNYIKIDNKDISLAILSKAITLKSIDLGKYLNTISYGWEYNSSKKCWINEQKQIAVMLNDDQSISYLSSSFNPKDFNDEIELLKFKRIDVTNNKPVSPSEKIKSSYLFADGIYENKDFNLIIKTIMLNQNSKLSVMINLRKK